ncbi:helix-turn-helix domain-containing protein [Paraburkholderia sp. BR14263]
MLSESRILRLKHYGHDVQTEREAETREHGEGRVSG